MVGHTKETIINKLRTVRHTIKTVIRMKTLNTKEARVFGNINVIAETTCGNKYFIFEDLADFDLDNTKSELKEILDSLVVKGYLIAFNDFDETYRLLK